MASLNLVAEIENHWEAIASDLVDEVRRDRSLPHYQSLSDLEIRERARAVIDDLHRWLVDANQMELGRHYEVLGARRHQQGIPLHELIQVTNVFKQRVFRFLLEVALGYSPEAIFQELEPLRIVGQYFDRLVYSIARGYSAASLLSLSSASSRPLAVRG